MSNIIQEIKQTLFAMQDLSYRDFHAKLMPTIDKETIIGVRTPALRKYAKEVAKHPDLADFLRDCPHQFYEENNLHGFVIEAYKDFDECLASINAFLPYVDNWATCDMMTPKVFKKYLPELLPQIRQWLDSGKTYTIRFGVNMLMKFYLDEVFDSKYLEWVSSIDHEDYYVKMVVAWYFATALAKQYEVTLPYIEEFRLEKWTHNKTIQKAIESYRITDEQKQFLRTLKIP